MIEALLVLPLFLLLGQIILGGCGCCAYCGMCTDTITTVQVTFTGITANLDTTGCCTALNQTYVLNYNGAESCCWSKTNTPGTNCGTAACTGCSCDYDTPCPCDAQTDLVYNTCDPNGGGADCGGRAGFTSTATLTGGGGGGNCDTCNSQTGAHSVCSGPLSDGSDCQNQPCENCVTCACQDPGVDTWPDPLPGDAPAWAVAGANKWYCGVTGNHCGFAGTCTAEYSNTEVCLTTSGSDGVMSVTGNVSGAFSASKTFTGAADTPINCSTELDLDATTFTNWTWTAAGSGLCNEPATVDIAVT